MNRQWRLPEADLAVPEGFRRAEWAILRARGIADPESAAPLLAPSSGVEHDPRLLTDLPAAVARIREAVSGGEKIIVYGDYDADGLTAAALLVSTLEHLGGDVHAFIPSRFEEGYGLQESALARLREDGAGLVVTVDCGTRALAEIRTARGWGLDIIVTDHHEPGEAMPEALALVNPKRPGDRYPFKGLSGVGLAYKLAQALAGDRPGAELVAVGTIADLAPLLDENRTLVARGLESLRRAPSPGLAALMDVAGVHRRRLTARDIAFGLGPRLNAAGRLGSAWDAYRLLRSVEPLEARAMAEALDRANRERQAQTSDLLERVDTRLKALDDPGPLIFQAEEAFGEGLLGPAAAKLVEEWHRPAVLVALRGDEARGSARSVEGFDITQALEACAPLLQRFGGHEAAAGFSLEARRVPDLADRLTRVARERIPQPGEPPPVEVDVLVTPDEVGDELMDFLDNLEPFGAGFPAPLLACQRMTLVDAKAIGRDRTHLRLLLRHPRGAREAIAFRQGHRRMSRGAVVDVAFFAERERYRGVESIRWNVQAMRLSPGD